MPSWGQTLRCIAVARHKSIEENDRADCLRHHFGNAGNDKPAVGMPAQHDRPVGRVDHFTARVDVGVQVAAFVAGLAAAGERHSDGPDAMRGERLGHLLPPPRVVTDTRPVNKDQGRHE